jgi:ABC-type uncharacterized transport system substrate-binding protein
LLVWWLGPIHHGMQRCANSKDVSSSLPAIYPFRYFAENGGLASYGFDTVAPHREAASYVDRILKGEKPGNLPVQAPTKYELVINLKTAKAPRPHDFA